eukprot:TRINITY_DN4317_c0_g1_i7.p1 TRINITY_DN4317_c0_g1~~TRINITY_DN4317_c0_g1_i7.p1  ORF type:complete len:306 (+),score=61.58 TRINITY_DN4317_c0_g1_i7:116-1033(+)
MSTYGGDSWAAEANLRHRRVVSLLGESVPDGEYVRLSNGKFSCSICRHRPIFDTLQMLSVHRDGKKHMAELLNRNEEQSRLQELKRERIRANMQSDRNQEKWKDKELTETRGSTPLIEQTRKRTQILLGQSSNGSIGENSTAVIYPQPTKRMKETDPLRDERERALQAPHIRRMKDATQLHAQLQTSQKRLLESLQSAKFPHDDISGRKDVGVYSSVGLYIYNPNEDAQDTIALRRECDVEKNPNANVVDEKTRMFSLYCDRMHRDGWVINPDGGWTRPSDGVAEFDSDEEPMTFEDFVQKGAAQ